MSSLPETAAAPPASPFSSLAIGLLVTVGIAAFSAFLVLSAYTPERGDSRASMSALSPSAVGFGGLVALLRAQDIPVVIDRVANAGAKPAMLVLTPPAAIPAARLAGATQTILVVLPKWDTVPDPDRSDWVDQRGLLRDASATAALPGTASLSRRPGREAAVLHGGTGLFAAVQGLPLPIIDRLQTIGTTADWTPMLLDEGGRVVLARRTRSGLPRVVVLTDPDLLDTGGLKDIAGARVAMTIIDTLRDGSPVTFDVTLNGLGRSDNLLQLLFEPPLLGATLCIAAGALLLLAMALHRFGPPVRPDRILDFGKRALADNSAALIALAGREPRMAVPYAELTRGLVVRAIGAPARLERAAIDAYLDQAANSRGLETGFTALAKRAADVKDRAMLMDLARRLNEWNQGMRRGRR